MSINQIYRIADKFKGRIVGAWASYFAAILTEAVSESATIREIAGTMFNFSKLSVIVLWIFFGVAVVVWVTCLICDRISLAQVPSAKFVQIMKDHTCPMLNKVEYSGFSWGYNRNLVVPRNPSGWKPEDIYSVS